MMHFHASRGSFSPPSPPSLFFASFTLFPRIFLSPPPRSPFSSLLASLNNGTETRACRVVSRRVASCRVVSCRVVSCHIPNILLTRFESAPRENSRIFLNNKIQGLSHTVASSRVSCIQTKFLL